MAMPTDRIEGAAKRGVVEVTGGQRTARQDLLAEEVPLAIHGNGEPLAVMMVTPCDLEDFAHGFALTELGIGGDDLLSVDVQALLEGIRLDLATRHPLPTRAATDQQRWLPGRSGCGICGNRHLEDVVRRPEAVGQGRRITPAALDIALAALEQRQPLNAATGAIHAAAWARADGTLVLVREDVGRHNALDKLIGAMRRQRIDAGSGFVLVTSRASYEMVAKAAMAGMPLLAAISAPTALAVDLAAGCGVTLVGFLRRGRHVVYSHPQRLDARQAPSDQ
ncbi:MAG: sulfurtransferase FdhD [Xanthomonas sp.]|nr:sulfurtransferase FdhD [Xanthomonas sp.]